MKNTDKQNRINQIAAELDMTAAQCIAWLADHGADISDLDGSDAYTLRHQVAHNMVELGNRVSGLSFSL